MLRLVTILAVLAAVCGFQPSRYAVRSSVAMNAEKQPSLLKIAGIALLGSSLLGTPVIAKEGTPAKISFFGDDTSSPFTLTEGREDPLYSPYSPYGDGSKAAYNGRKGGKEELAFWNGKFAESL